MVYVYMTNIKDLPDPKEHRELLQGLTEERKLKTLRYKREEGRKQSLGAGMLLKQVLLRHGLCMENIRYGENGKPEIDGIHFNLSHSHDIVVCTVSDKAVGCDVEKIESVKEKIAERFFTKNEVAYLKSFEGEKKADEFYRLWTMKESYMKMTGEGMSLGLDRIEFVFDESIKVCRDGKRCACSIKEYELPGYKLSVCAEETEFAEIYDIMDCINRY